MNFSAFLDSLNALQMTISITSPIATTVRRTYWGAPTGTIIDVPAIVNDMTETERSVGMGARGESRYRVGVQLLAAKATPEDTRSSIIATELWFAAKRAFDANPTISGTVTHAILRGANPTVPVLLQHAGQTYIGFEAMLDIQHIT
jgi:hypothetical protein